ncbi:MAG: ArnT family glycosyltransferase [Bacteroidia bacterium]
MRKYTQNIIHILIILSGVYFFIFHNASKLILQIWDESLYAVNAAEMWLNKEFFKYYFMLEPTTYNVKPPLVIWFQLLSINFFGINEFSIRLPSLLAGLIICFAIFYFIKKHFNTIAAFSVLIFLLSTYGFNRPHVIRTGDLDGVLLLFTSCYTLVWLQMLLNKNIKSIWLFALLVFLACISKSVAGLIPLTGIVFATLGTGNFWIFKSIKLYIYALIVLMLYIIYYLIAEFYNPGTINLVYESEILRLTKDIMTWHHQPWHYYFSNLFYNNLGYYTYLLFILPVSLFFTNKTQQKIILFCIIYSLSILLFISIPPTKIASYDASVYPFLVICIGCCIFILIQTLTKKIKQDFVRKFLFLITIIIITYPALVNTLKLNNFFLPKDEFEKTGYAMKQLSVVYPEIKQYYVYMPTKYKEHKAQAWFYMLMFNDRGYNIQFSDSIHQNNINYMLVSNTYKDSILFEHKLIAEIEENRLIKLND